MELKVVSWNIHKGIGGFDRTYDLERIARLLIEEAPDIALLQEVADGWPTTQSHAQAHLLAEMTGLTNLVFEPEHRFRTGGYGNAILSRFPLQKRERVDLTCGWRKTRGAAQADVLIPVENSEVKMQLTNLHLGLAESERRKQIERVLSHHRRLCQRSPALIGGDFNDVFGTLGSRIEKDDIFVRAGERRHTFPAAFPLLSLDGIFASRVEIVNGAPAKTHLTRRASDHLPLTATIRLSPPFSD